ncbi:MAG: hypothetical protein DSY37_01905 [Hyperthermus sp.]|nr:MAG: hypothetical protein DSY37_01905 [Hyperthermus sp.]
MRSFTLILGTPLTTTVQPWLYMDIRAVMVSSYDLLMRGDTYKIRGRGLRKLLNLPDDVELWIDSGGYQFLNGNGGGKRRNVLRQIDPSKIAELYSRVDADYYVSLDYPPGPQASLEQRAWYITRSINSFTKLSHKLRHLVDEGRLIPVFHLSTDASLRLQLAVYDSYAEIAAAGGLIPYVMQKSGRGSREKALLFLALLRKLWKGRLHALGLASATMIPLLRIIGVESGDTQTWRLKAAYGKIIIPGLGERHVSGRKVSFGPATLKGEEEEILAKYLDMASRTIDVTYEDLVESFEARAIFNAWVLKFVSENFHGYNGLSKAFSKLYQKALVLRQLNASRIEELLKQLIDGSSIAWEEYSSIDVDTVFLQAPLTELGGLKENISA